MQPVAARKGSGLPWGLRIVINRNTITGRVSFGKTIQATSDPLRGFTFIHVPTGIVIQHTRNFVAVGKEESMFVALFVDLTLRDEASSSGPVTTHPGLLKVGVHCLTAKEYGDAQQQEAQGEFKKALVHLSEAVMMYEVLALV